MHAELVDLTRGRLKVRFTNDAAEPQWLSRARALIMHQPDSGFLETVPECDYIGRVLYRMPYRERELLEVLPGSTVESDAFVLHDLYDVPNGPVQVRYAAYHPLAGIDQVEGPMTSVVSPAITVEPRAR